MSDKRKDYISWDEYFMGVAKLSALRSKDPNTQVGACIVSNDNKILSMGYNGLPRGCSDDEFPCAGMETHLTTSTSIQPTVSSMQYLTTEAEHLTVLRCM